MLSQQTKVISLKILTFLSDVEARFQRPKSEIKVEKREVAFSVPYIVC